MDNSASDCEQSQSQMSNVAEIAQRHAEERAALKKKHEKTRSGIPKKDRIGRQRFLEGSLEEQNRLDNAHKSELEQLGISEDDITRSLTKLTMSSATVSSNEESRNSNGGRTESKAARRRRKKAEQEAESQKRIDEEKEAMGPSLKSIELNAINEQINPKHLRIHAILADGHCLYSAIAHQMQLLLQQSSPPSFIVSPTVNDLRQASADYLIKHKQEFMPFIESVEGSNERFQNYCDELRNTAVWGGHVELEVLSKFLSVIIEVYAADMPVIRVGVNHDGKQDNDMNKHVLRVSFHRQYLGLGEHYNSIVPNGFTK